MNLASIARSLLIGFLGMQGVILPLTQILGQSPIQENRTRMGWPLPISNEECWKILPKPLEGEGEALPNWARMLARELPLTTAAFLELDRAHRTQGRVEPVLRAAMRWMAAKANGCEYAMAVARSDGMREGASTLAWRGLEDGSFAGWTDNQRDALKFAHAMTVDSEGISDESFARLVEEFSDRQVACMVLHMAYANFQDRLLLSLGVSEELNGPLPPSKAKFDPKSLVIETTPPDPKQAKAASSFVKSTSEATASVEGRIGQIAEATPYTWLPYDQLQVRLKQQRERATRLRVPDWEEFADRLPKGMMDKPSKIVWYRIAFGYADELAVPFEFYMRTAGSEISKNWDRIFGNSVFWIVTDAMKCPYCMGHCEMNWEVAGMAAVDIAKRSEVLAGNDWSMFSVSEQAALKFARKLTVNPASIEAKDLDAMRAGFGDQRALFLALNSSRYNYMTRISNGFQLTLESENVFWDYYRMQAPGATDGKPK